MKCNSCWRNLEGRGVATTCGHVFCIEDATRILSSDSTCPLCERMLSKGDMKAVDTSPKDDWVNMAMAGVPPDCIMKSAFKGVVFWIGQKDVEAQVTISKAVQLRQKFEEMQARYMEKLQQVHAAYQKAMKKLQALDEEKNAILKDKNELQEKYAEKSRQKRKLEEMYEALRGEYEKAKQTASATLPHNRPQIGGFPQSNQYQFTGPSLSGLDDPNPQLKPDSARSMEFSNMAPLTPAHYPPLWPARQKPGPGLFDLPGRPRTGSGTNVLGWRDLNNEGGSSDPFKTSDQLMASNVNSNRIRNMLLSPMKRPTNRLPPSGFST